MADEPAALRVLVRAAEHAARIDGLFGSMYPPQLDGPLAGAVVRAAAERTADGGR